MSLNLSLRTKISVLFTIILILMTSANVYFATKVLRDDKVAYIYEKNSSLLRFYSQQLQSEAESLLKITDYLFVNFQAEKKIDEISEFFLKSDSSIAFFEIRDSNGVLVYKYSNKDIKSQDMGPIQFPQVSEVGKIQLSGFKEFLIIHERKKISDTRNSTNTDAVDIEITQNTPNENEKLDTFSEFTFHLGYKSKTMGLISEKSKISEQFVLFDKNGNDLIASSNFDDKMKGQLFEQIKNSTSNLNQITTKEINFNASQKYLTSSVAISQLGLSLFSLTPMDMALGALKVLLQKSVLMSIAFIAIGAFLTLLLAKVLTEKLSLLLFATNKISAGDFNIAHDFEVKTKDEFGSLFTSFKIMSEKIIDLLAETKELSRLESELKTAKTVQETLLPLSSFENSDVIISGYYESASEVGGDIWGYYEKNNKFYVWLGDVTGHGTPAALLTSAVKSAVVIMEEQDLLPNEILKKLNRVVYEVSKKKLMMTFFIGIYDYTTREFSYASAGQEPPLVFRSADQIDKSSIEPLTEANGPRLGQSLESSYTSHSISLGKNDVLFSYTDGLVDIRSPDEKQFNERKFTKVIIDSLNAKVTPQILIENINFVSKEFSSGTPLIDDVTYFALQVKS